jgi:hypothetical protein
MDIAGRKAIDNFIDGYKNEVINASELQQFIYMFSYAIRTNHKFRQFNYLISLLDSETIANNNLYDDINTGINNVINYGSIRDILDLVSYKKYVDFIVQNMIEFIVNPNNSLAEIDLEPILASLPQVVSFWYNLIQSGKSVIPLESRDGDSTEIRNINYFNNIARNAILKSAYPYEAFKILKSYLNCDAFMAILQATPNERIIKDIISSDCDSIDDLIKGLIKNSSIITPDGMLAGDFARLILTIYARKPTPNRIFEEAKFSELYPHLDIYNFIDNFDWHVSYDQAIINLEKYILKLYEPGNLLSKSAIDDSDFRSGQMSERCYKNDYTYLQEVAIDHLDVCNPIQLCVAIAQYKDKIEMPEIYINYELRDLINVIQQLIPVLVKKDLCNLIYILGGKEFLESDD